MIHDMQLPWKMAKVRKNFVFWFTLPMIVSETFWNTWSEVYTPTR
jgi:hypothetical protein